MLVSVLVVLVHHSEDLFHQVGASSLGANSYFRISVWYRAVLMCARCSWQSTVQERARGLLHTPTYDIVFIYTIFFIDYRRSTLFYHMDNNIKHLPYSSLPTKLSTIHEAISSSPVSMACCAQLLPTIISYKLFFAKR